MGANRSQNRREKRILKREGVRTYPIPEDLLASDAYFSLSMTERAILIDLLALYYRVTGWEKSQTTFSYTWGTCTVPVSEETFNTARKRIVLVGFLDELAEDQSNEPGGSKRYRVSARWLSYKLTREELARRERRESAKRNRIARQRARRTAFRERAPGKKPTPKNRGVQANHHPKIPGHNGPDHPKIQGDGTAIGTVDPPQILGGVTDTTCGVPKSEAVESESDTASVRKRPAKSVPARIKTATGCDETMFKWWRRLHRDFDDDGKRVLETWLAFLEDSNTPAIRSRKSLSEIPNPGSYLLEKITAWAKGRRIALPPFPDGGHVHE